MESRQGRATIDDFGAQWLRYRSNDGYYGSRELLADILGGLLEPELLRDSRVCEIGSGTGRIVNMLVESGVKEVIAIEPSAAFEVLIANTAAAGDRVHALQVRGDELPAGLDVDYVLSIGVLHHIPQPAAVVTAAFNALRPGGKLLVWLYGRENNEAYLSWVLPLRRFTTKLPDRALSILCYGLNVCLAGYALLCRIFPLPLAAYMRNVIGKFTWKTRFLVIFDQLNPAYARYYTEHEARELLAAAGFIDVQTHHRHGYSWTVRGTRPG